MSNLAINDLSEATVLDRAATAGIAGGMDVDMDEISSTVESTDGQSGAAGNLFGALLNSVVEGIRQQSQRVSLL